MCDHAENCADAARDFKPHIMILHGGLSPHQACDLAREIQGPTIVRVTEPGDILHSREALEAGIALHLAAPVMAAELAAVCRQVAESLPAE